MKIAMFTNTYLPHVGGVARSVKTLEDACRRYGHDVRVVAPKFEGAEPTPLVLRVPAIQHFNGSDFSLRLPFPAAIHDFLDDFRPDIIHSHHPFLLGDTALREAWKRQIPIIFTHHTLYERYTHYVPLDSPALKRVVIQLATEYCNLCDQVIAPSSSIEQLLRERAVTAPIAAIPTGIDTRFFGTGDGPGFRRTAGIPPKVKVIGHVGRLAVEKNLSFIAEAVAQCLEEDPEAHFLLVGDGGGRDPMVTLLKRVAGEDRIHAVGKKTGHSLADAYAAMDCFVFASQTETQGLVLAEAMAAGLPVVALDGPGVREIVRNGRNGFLLPADASPRDFSIRVHRLLHDPATAWRCSDHAREDAAAYDTEPCVRRVLDCYQELISHPRILNGHDDTPWNRLLMGIGIEWDLLTEKVSAAAAAVVATPATRASLQ